MISSSNTLLKQTESLFPRDLFGIRMLGSSKKQVLIHFNQCKIKVWQLQDTMRRVIEKDFLILPKCKYHRLVHSSRIPTIEETFQVILVQAIRAHMEHR